eukprot:9475743-Pyramimonas_sp.AAC.1
MICVFGLRTGLRDRVFARPWLAKRDIFQQLEGVQAGFVHSSTFDNMQAEVYMQRALACKRCT